MGNRRMWLLRFLPQARTVDKGETCFRDSGAPLFGSSGGGAGFANDTLCILKLIFPV